MSLIAKWFESSATGRPFRHCGACRMPLIEIDAPWVVNKEIRDGQCALEYAICEPCRDRFMEDIPEATKENIRQFLENEIDWEARVREMFGQIDDDARFRACIRCRTPRSKISDFAISARFHSNGQPDIGPLPLLICRPCYALLANLFCDTSRKVWQRFLTEAFDEEPPDEFFGLL